MTHLNRMLATPDPPDSRELEPGQAKALLQIAEARNALETAEADLNLAIHEAHHQWGVPYELIGRQLGVARQTAWRRAHLVN